MAVLLAGNDWAVSGAVNAFPVARITEALENPGKHMHNGHELTFPGPENDFGGRAVVTLLITVLQTA